jgi:transposase-like protein
MRSHSPFLPIPPARTTAAQRATYVTAFAESGQSVAAFCRAHGVVVGTFARWRREVGPTRRPRFARVVVAEPAPALVGRLVIQGPAGTAEITGVDAATLVRLARTVLRAR